MFCFLNSVKKYTINIELLKLKQFKKIYGNFFKILENSFLLLYGQTMITQRLPLGSPGITHKKD